MVPGQRPNNGDNAKQQPENGSLQQDQLSENRRLDDKKPRKPREERLTKAQSFNGDVRNLPYRRPVNRERRELPEPPLNPTLAPGTTEPAAPATTNAFPVGGPSAPAPAPNNVFEGLDRFNWGAGHPPDTNGDVGPTYYIQTINTSIGIFRKSDGFHVAAFTFNTFMSQGNFGNLCDTNNFGDPVVLYDTFEDRWIITDFAFQTDVGGNVARAGASSASRSRRPAIRSAAAGTSTRSASPTASTTIRSSASGRTACTCRRTCSRSAPASSFQTRARLGVQQGADVRRKPDRQGRLVRRRAAATSRVLPSNARLQTGTPPPGTPNYFSRPGTSLTR